MIGVAAKGESERQSGSQLHHSNYAAKIPDKGLPLPYASKNNYNSNT
jgi:hypothetical protein